VFRGGLKKEFGLQRKSNDVGGHIFMPRLDGSQKQALEGVKEKGILLDRYNCSRMGGKDWSSKREWDLEEKQEGIEKREEEISDRNLV